ncbi:hypothetical protein EYF80_063436 [Liparis tanakae]|uniref:Uncharacterized protein n=1 Tax=Liparis tanakae TaxID=230148 RepID=A0A4Z2EC07_9TELE|nr:hypothetical protein EYF80_063436 [Liparis tanakae]
MLSDTRTSPTPPG